MNRPGYVTAKADHLRRLRRIEGQVRGLERMITEDASCIDVLTQISSATKALQAVGIGLLDEHLHHCVNSAAGESPTSGDAAVHEAVAAVERLLRS